MPELPKISGNDAIKVFKRLGFYEARQKGSHVVMRREDKGCVIPRHKSLAIGILHIGSGLSYKMIRSVLSDLHRSEVYRFFP